MHHRHIIQALMAGTVTLCAPDIASAQPAPAPMEVAIITAPGVPKAIEDAMREACDRSTRINLHATPDANLAPASIDKPTWSISEEETRRIGAAMEKQNIEVVILVGVWNGARRLVVLGPTGKLEGKLDANLDVSAPTFKPDVDALLERALTATARSVLAHRASRSPTTTTPPSSTVEDDTSTLKANTEPARGDAVRMLPKKILFVDVHGNAHNTIMEFSGEKQRYATLNTAGAGFHAHGDTPFTAFFKYRWHLGGYFHRGSAITQVGVDNVQEERVTGRGLGVGISAIFPIDARAQFGPMLGYEFSSLQGGPPVPTSKTKMGRLLWTLRVPYERFALDAAMGFQVGTAEDTLGTFTPTGESPAFGLEASTNATVLIGERVILRAGARVRRVTIEGTVSPSSNFSTFNDRHIHSDLGVGVAL